MSEIGTLQKSVASPRYQGVIKEDKEITETLHDVSSLAFTIENDEEILSTSLLFMDTEGEILPLIETSKIGLEQLGKLNSNKSLSIHLSFERAKHQGS